MSPSAAHTPDVPTGGPRAWINWALGSAFVVVVFVIQSAYAITNPAVASDLALTLTQVGFVGSVYTWVFAMAQFASGSMLDRMGVRRTIPFAAAVVTLGAVLFARADSYVALVVAQMLMAAGASFGFVGAGFIGRSWFAPAKYGLMFSLVQFVASSGAVIGQRSISALLASGAADWRAIVTGLAVIGAVVTALMFVLLRDRPGARPQADPRDEGLIESILHSVNAVASIRASWVNALVAGVMFGTMFAVGVVWGPRLAMARGISAQDANAVSALCWLGLATGAPVISWLSQRSGRLVRPMLVSVVLQAVCGIAILTVAGGAGLAAALFYAFGFASAGSMLCFTYGAAIVPERLVGTSAAVVNAVQFILSGIFMAIPGNILTGAGFSTAGAGPVATIGDYRVAMSVFPIALIGASFLVLLLREPGSTESIAERERDRRAL